MREDLKAIVKYRLEQAEESLKDASILIDSGGSFRSIINRSYYAMFYATLALIAEKGTGRSKHSGVISIFDREYVRKKIFPKEMSKLIHKSFNLRQESDYREFNIITKEDAQKIKSGAEDFLKMIRDYLKEQ
ncbi:MAG: HEPN domain-containing protein [bacterium]|nr:HEPN domain-containing protein [bacterium]